MASVGWQLGLKLGAHAWAKLNRRILWRQHRIREVFYLCNLGEIAEGVRETNAFEPPGAMETLRANKE